MRIAVLSLVTFAVAVVAAPGAARADGIYYLEEVGAAGVGSEMGRYFDDGLQIHWALGENLGDWAIEPYLQLDIMEGKGIFGDANYGALSYGVEVRRMFPLNGWARAYLRGGLDHMSVSSQADGNVGLGDDYSGRGYDYGGGLMVSGRVPALGLLFSPLFFCRCGPKISAGAWLDLGQQVVRLRKARASTLDGELTSLSAGFSFGGNF